MGTHMKTTIDIADPLLDAAKAAAQQRGTTLRALVEMGLRHVLDTAAQDKPAFQLRDASFGGNGLQPGTHGASWEQLRALAYGDSAQ